MKTLGEEHLKNGRLNKRAFVCIGDNFRVNGYVEGQSVFSSPPLSAATSAKPSAIKTIKISKPLKMQDYGKRSCKLTD